AFALRDGGVNGGAYLANTSGAASFSAHLLAIQAKMDQPMAFDPMAGAGASGSIMDYSTSSISWLQGVRQTADNAAQTKQALVVRTAEALSNATGVNVDEELALLIELEHSYGASARLLKAADDMLASLLAAVS
ncbi:MAG: flagellar basal body rod C-terminal domain-containing protein, partial [Mesorhizobium sp.]